MKKASHVLLTVGMVVSTVAAAILFALVPVFIVVGVSPHIHDLLVEAINNGEIKVSGVSAEEAVAILQGVFIGCGVLIALIAGSCLANAIISSKARRNPTHNLLVAAIVTGALSTDFSLVGGIFGLITLAKANRNKQIEE